MRLRKFALALALVASLAIQLVGVAQRATPVAGSEVLFTGWLPADVLPSEAGPVYVARATYPSGDGEE